MSYREAERASGLGYSLISHLESGRVAIHSRHLVVPLAAYGVTMQTFEMFAEGRVALPQNLRAECIELIQKMSVEQLRTALPVLLSLSYQK